MLLGRLGHIRKLQGILGGRVLYLYINIYIGLRVLSVRVRELVFSKRETSYKEVADQLIEELAIKGKIIRGNPSHPNGSTYIVLYPLYIYIYIYIEQGREECTEKGVRCSKCANSSWCN